MVHKVKYLIIIILAFFVVTVTYSQEAKVNHRQISRQQKKNDKKAMKEYRLRVKKHHKAQSKETRSMMKASYRKSKKATPLKPD